MVTGVVEFAESDTLWLGLSYNCSDIRFFHQLRCDRGHYWEERTNSRTVFKYFLGQFFGNRFVNFCPNWYFKIWCQNVAFVYSSGTCLYVVVFCFLVIVSFLFFYSSNICMDSAWHFALTPTFWLETIRCQYIYIASLLHDCIAFVRYTCGQFIRTVESLSTSQS